MPKWTSTWHLFTHKIFVLALTSFVSDPMGFKARVSFFNSLIYRWLSAVRFRFYFSLYSLFYTTRAINNFYHVKYKIQSEMKYFNPFLILFYVSVNILRNNANWTKESKSENNILCCVQPELLTYLSRCRTSVFVYNHSVIFYYGKSSTSCNYIHTWL